MSSEYTYECQICFPSLKRALKRVPAEFEQGYAWFQEMEGKAIAGLPMGKYQPAGLTIPLARQSGIYSPSKSSVKYEGRRYALSIHSNDLDRYGDRTPIFLSDGSWVFSYAAQDNNADSVKGQSYNDSMMNCLTDGAPVGVMIREHGVWKVWGLAYVERYDSITKMFTLHGPVNAKTETAHAFDLIVPDDLDVEQPAEDDIETEELTRYAQRMQRIKQGEFRKNLLEAYEGQCAVTSYDVPEVLQAAHIEPYRGSRSQHASNGILLRSDIHLLYDAHLLSITPDTHEVELSDLLLDTPYQTLEGSPIIIPKLASARPDDELLENHYRQFRSERSLVA